MFLQNEMGLDKKLDSQPEPTGRHIIHLLADAIPQIQPETLSFAAGELQPKVVHFNYAQLSANLEKDEGTRRTHIHKKGEIQTRNLENFLKPNEYHLSSGVEEERSKQTS